VRATLIHRVTPSSERGYDWRDDAACVSNPNLFHAPFAEKSQAKERREQEAKTVCRTCEVRLDCLEYALSRPEPDGVWGGMGEQERRDLRREARWGKA
jgi:WhiB family redox-sensing transcriptional regulator